MNFSSKIQAWKAAFFRAADFIPPREFRYRQPLLAVLVLAAGVLLSWWLLETGPAAKERKPKPSSVLVEVRPVELGPDRSRVEAFGTVIPAREVELKSQVSGEVVRLGSNLLPGGLVQAGEILVGLDQADHALAVRQLAGEVAEAEAALKMEQGNREVARREYELSGEKAGGDSLELMLRKPQFATAQARLESARARLERAGLDLARTTVRSPFAAVVRKKEVELGSRLVVNAPLCTLVGTERFWIEVVVPVGQLKWLAVPRTDAEHGSPVRIYDAAAWGEDVCRQGHVLRLAGDLEEEGRLARLLVAVDDPLGLKDGPKKMPRLFIGSYVRVEIEGKKLEAVARVERGLLRDGDHVWLMTKDKQLEIRPVDVAFRGRDTVLVSGGLAAGELLVVSDLAAPVAGMRLRTPGMPEEKGEAKAGKSGKSKGGGE